MNGPALVALTNLGGIPLPKGKLTPPQKKKAINDAMNWLRNNDPNPTDVDEPTAQALANLAGVPLPGNKLSPAAGSYKHLTPPTTRLG